MPQLFCFGLSYCAQALIEVILNSSEGAHWQIAATVRDQEVKRHNFQDRVLLLEFDGVTLSQQTEEQLLQATHVLHSIPPGLEGDPIVTTAANVLQDADQLSWFGYLSTTAVYGDHKGAWVDEETPRIPAAARGQRRIDAEDALLNLYHRHRLPLHIFRLAGIYGPGRNQLLSVRGGTAKRIIKPDQVFSRIHVEDIAQTLMRSINAPNPGRAYNVCDDLPTPPQDVVAYAAELLSVSPPPEIPFDAAELSPMARSFYGENKRVSNARIKNELGVSLNYPTYREGLDALMLSLNDSA